MAERASSVPKLSSSSLSVLILPERPDTLYSRSPSNWILEQLHIRNISKLSSILPVTLQ